MRFRQHREMYDPNDHKIIATLLAQCGDRECQRLGFLERDDNATLYVTAKGLGYLLDVVAADCTTLQEAYAAGYDQGYVQAREGF
jgi:hypothetical protein